MHVGLVTDVKRQMVRLQPGEAACAQVCPIKSSAFQTVFQVTGEAVYTDDIPLPPRALHAVLVLSARPHARLLSVDASAALQVPLLNYLAIHKPRLRLASHSWPPPWCRLSSLVPVASQGDTVAHMRSWQTMPPQVCQTCQVSRTSAFTPCERHMGSLSQVEGDTQVHRGFHSAVICPPPSLRGRRRVWRATSTTGTCRATTTLAQSRTMRR